MIGVPQRCVQGAPITVTFTPVDSNGEPSSTDPGTVTVGVVRADGTEVVAPATATTTVGASRTFVLTAAQTAVLDQLTVTWTASAATIGRTVVDVVGNVYATSADIRGTEKTTSDTERNPDDDLLRVRAEIEATVERACGHVLAFVPRFAVAQVDHRGGPSLRLPHYYVRGVRWVKYGSANGTLIDFTDHDLATTVLPDSAGMPTITGGLWPYGRLLVGYEHGMDAPPPDVKRAAIAAIRRGLNRSRSAIDARAMSHTMPSGEIQRFPTPGLGPWVTGIPEIDEVLAWYDKRYPTLAVA